MTSRDPDEPIVWRAPFFFRLPNIVATTVLALVLLLVSVLSPAQPFTWLLLAALLLVTFGTLRRRCTLVGSRLVAVGRFARREVDLADLRQAGVGWNSVWVQTRHPLNARGGDTLWLRVMAPIAARRGGAPPPPEAVVLLRARAEAAGATLEPALPGPQVPRSGKLLLFGL